MSNLNQSTTQKYQIPAYAWHLPKIDTTNIASKVYGMFILALGTVLVGLGLRIVLALFVYDGWAAHAVTYISEPFVAPFAHYFHDTHEMIQISTATAFTIYYFSYWFINLFHSAYRRVKFSLAARS